MKGVCSHAVADNLGINVRAALLRQFEFFKDQDARAFANNESVAIPLKGTAGVLRIVVAGGESPHRSESSNTHRRDRRLCPAANHHIGIAALNNPEAVADSMSACGTRCGGG